MTGKKTRNTAGHGEPTLSNRREVLGKGAAIGGAVASGLGSVSAAPAQAGYRRHAHPVFGSDFRRLKDALDVRVNAARDKFLQPTPRQRTNGDEGRYDDYRASFHKCLLHNKLGEVEPRSYKSLLRALRDNRARTYENIRLDNTVRTRKLANPQGAYKFDLVGIDSHATRMPPAPTFES
ncbi:MAG: hypothetical protein AAF986_02535, partial [Pseudomonadota bacterium]